VIDRYSSKESIMKGLWFVYATENDIVKRKYLVKASDYELARLCVERCDIEIYNPKWELSVEPVEFETNVILL
jgi:hypothetical protein